MTHAWAWSLVGASSLAMDVNDNARDLDERGVLESIASRLAPTGVDLDRASAPEASGQQRIETELARA
ncbi:hypothetical protein EKG40_19935 [Pseudomonas moorei]|nr:hypothetical protein EKG40_19935 [Pseudomonas moorei]